MVKFYNSLTRKIQPFKPLKKGKVSMYACGPTVYKSAHIGNMRTYIFEDLLRRVLEYNGYKIKHVMNITDVGHLTSDADSGDDKVEREAKKTGKRAKDITKHFADLFKSDLKALNIKSPDKFTWASKYIKEQIDFIKRLEKKGYAYATSDGVFFDTGKFKKYEQLGTISTGRSRIKHHFDRKRDSDFSLWKLSKPGEKRQQEWKSPWGVGYPGWHLECSVMSMLELGQPFDIHLGGEDHKLIHHNSEIAQSEAAYGKPLANYWIHGAFMLMNKAKMAKSTGNFLTLSDLNVDPLVFRYLVISSHYRHKLNFSQLAMKSAENSLNKLYAMFMVKTKGGRICKKCKEGFMMAINNDLNMPEAMKMVWQLVRAKDKTLADKQATLLEFDKVLGLGLKDCKSKAMSVPVAIKKLVEEREKARQANNWKLADKIRQISASKGYIIEDSAGGPIVTPK